MTRRWALAASLALTVVVGFFVVTYGTNAGVFAWSGGGSAAQDAGAITSSPAQGLPADAPAAASAASSAEVVNIDEASLQSTGLGRSDDDAREHEGDGEHERDRGEREPEDDD